jgi:hypothetical protein
MTKWLKQLHHKHGSILSDPSSETCLECLNKDPKLRKTHPDPARVSIHQECLQCNWWTVLFTAAVGRSVSSTGCLVIFGESVVVSDQGGRWLTSSGPHSHRNLSFYLLTTLLLWAFGHWQSSLIPLLSPSPCHLYFSRGG